MFGYIYQLVLVWDALRLKNTIQVIGIVIYNIGILVYAGIQFDQIRDAADDLNDSAFIPRYFWKDVKPMLIALPVLMAVATIFFAFEAWKLYDEFAWTIYKRISADTRLKRRYLTYQVHSFFYTHPTHHHHPTNQLRFTSPSSSSTSSSFSPLLSSSSSSSRTQRHSNSPSLRLL